VAEDLAMTIGDITVLMNSISILILAVCMADHLRSHR
jgi:hypothetical protein